MAGDKSPDVNREGGILALKKFDDLELIFIGRQEIISEKLKGYDYDQSRVQIVDAKEEISCNDVPTVAIRAKKDSSLYIAFDMLKTNDDICAMVSNGSTGAIVAGTVMKLGRLSGVKRPGLCPILPTMNGGVVAVCDSGACVECDSLMLNQFAVMASLYMEKTFGIQNPRVALLNVGVEPEKGDSLRKETYKLLSEDKTINFVGNMESRDLMSGKYDVVVCDGFAGNVLCKSTEGACLEVSRLTAKMLAKNKEAALMLKDDIEQITALMDYNNYGGAVVLGAAKSIVKAHGSCEAITILHSVEQAYNMEKNKLNDGIVYCLKTAE